MITDDKRWLYEIIEPHKNLTVQDWKKSLESHVLYSQVDINLAPLSQSSFNNKKSELRLLEAGAWGVPSVSSDVAPYRRFHEKSGGANIVVKKEKTRYWIEAIEYLLNKVQWERHSELSLKAVREYYDLKNINRLRAQWWAAVLDLAVPASASRLQSQFHLPVVP